MTEGVDYAFTVVDERQLYAAGKRFAGRYIGPGSDAKHLHADERDRLFAAGLSIMLLAEGGAGDAFLGHDMGVTHARQAAAAAAALGAPNTTAIYFAADKDTDATTWPKVREYLGGAASVLGPGRVGIYGEYDVMRWAAQDKAAAWFFQTYAWSHGMWFGGNHVEQYHNGAALAGGVVDLCRAKVANFGQWSHAAPPQHRQEEEQVMRFRFAPQVGGDGKHVYVTDGLRYRVQPLSFDVDGWYDKAGAGPVVTVDKLPNAGWTYDQLIASLCGTLDPGEHVDDADDPHEYTVTLSGVAKPATK